MLLLFVLVLMYQVRRFLEIILQKGAKHCSTRPQYYCSYGVEWPGGEDLNSK